MRPVDKGSAPNVYTKYQDAGTDLQARIGDYCSYCERQIETHLAVEHIQPKIRRPSLRNAWRNFLLGCVHCNSSKGKRRVNVRDHFWPDLDNTLRAFKYNRGGLITPQDALNRAMKAKAQASIILTGLDKYPGNCGREPSASDRRWLRRLETWQLAEKDKQRLAINDTLEVRELIVENAVARGMFSVWWTVFSDDANMRLRLREAFRGTDAGCFDAHEDLVPRTGGQL
jgi:uncharacterized protein (TIGR02646 family)